MDPETPESGDEDEVVNDSWATLTRLSFEGISPRLNFSFSNLRKKACDQLMSIIRSVTLLTTPSFLPHRRFRPGYNTHGTSKDRNGRSKEMAAYEAGNSSKKS